MPRLLIEIKGKQVFECTLSVRITDINYGNHTGNDKIAGFLHEARVQWLHQHNLTELDLGGAGWIMSDLAIQYLQESVYGDVIKIRLYADEIKNSSFELYYMLTQADDESKIIAKAKTGMVFFDYKTRKIAAIPSALRELLKN